MYISMDGYVGWTIELEDANHVRRQEGSSRIVETSSAYRFMNIIYWLYVGCLLWYGVVAIPSTQGLSIGRGLFCLFTQRHHGAARRYFLERTIVQRRYHAATMKDA